MKRVCTLRKVHFSVSKVLLEKLFFIVLKYRGFYHHSVFIVLIYRGFFMTTQFFLFLSYLQPGDFLCCKYKYFFRNLQVFEHFFSKKAIFLMFFIK